MPPTQRKRTAPKPEATEAPKQPTQPLPCLECFPGGVPEGVFSVGCVHGSWTATEQA